jgi:hypothetical protein
MAPLIPGSVGRGGGRYTVRALLNLPSVVGHARTVKVTAAEAGNAGPAAAILRNSGGSLLESRRCHPPR